MQFKVELQIILSVLYTILEKTIDNMYLCLIGGEPLPPPSSSSPYLNTFNFSIPSKKFYGEPKSSKGQATYLPQGPSTSKTVFNLKTNYELLGQKLKFEFLYLKTASDKVDPRELFVDLEELYKILFWSNLLAPSQKKLFKK